MASTFLLTGMFVFATEHNFRPVVSSASPERYLKELEVCVTGVTQTLNGVTGAEQEQTERCHQLFDLRRVTYRRLPRDSEDIYSHKAAPEVRSSLAWLDFVSEACWRRLEAYVNFCSL